MTPFDEALARAESAVGVPNEGDFGLLAMEVRRLQRTEAAVGNVTVRAYSLIEASRAAWQRLRALPSFITLAVVLEEREYALRSALDVLLVSMGGGE